MPKKKVYRVVGSNPATGAALGDVTGSGYAMLKTPVPIQTLKFNYIGPR